MRPVCGCCGQPGHFSLERGRSRRKHFIELDHLYQCCVSLIVGEGCAQTPETLEINFVNGKLSVLLLLHKTLHARYKHRPTDVTFQNALYTSCTCNIKT